METKKLYYHIINLENKICRYKELKDLLETNRTRWKVKKKISAKTLLSALVEEGKVERVELDFRGRIETLYLFENKSPYSISLQIKSESYLTHKSAMFFNDMIVEEPKRIYVNFEQVREKNRERALEQSRIHYAFSNNIRTSKNIAQYKGYEINLLNGMFTNKLGVIERVIENNERISHTDVERTLIDISVRPVYAGSITEVQNAYKKAKDRVSIPKLVEYLKKLNYVYPYHQAIGFYLESSKLYNKSEIDLMKEFELKYDFYLDYNMQDKLYSREWKIYYPSHLKTDD